MPEPVILVHRAQVWAAEHRSMPVKWGVALDVRLWDGKYAFLSHEAPKPELNTGAIYDLVYGEEFLAADLALFGLRPIYAWHLHEDDAEEVLARQMVDFPEVQARSFVFGGSYPMMRRAKALGLVTAQRISEEEPWETVPGRPTSHCWLDRWDWNGEVAYYEPHQSPEDFAQQRIYIPSQVRIWAASAELHVGKSPWAWLQHHWRLFFRLGVAGICTDYPVECEQAYAAWKAEGGHG